MEKEIKNDLPKRVKNKPPIKDKRFGKDGAKPAYKAGRQSEILLPS